MSELNMRQLLRGCEVGQIQTVGVMQMIPLLSDLSDDRFSGPYDLKVKTTHYGSMCFSRTDSAPYQVIPAHIAYISKQKAQDHAMMHAKFLKQKAETFSDAACIQQTQGGYLNTDGSEMSMLPLSLRETALSLRNEQSYTKLWKSISHLRAEVGHEGSANLVEFTKNFQTELSQFVAEFERDHRQLGAIILVNGEVVGVERCPNHQYFAEMWEPLIRGCYAAEAVRQVQLGINRGPRVSPLREATDIADLRLALREAEERDSEQVKAVVRDLIDDPFEQTQEDTLEKLTLLTLSNAQFIGQIVQEGEYIHYVSLTIKSNWSRDQSWREADVFEI